MSRTLSAEDVLKEIEFELIQGALANDEIGEGIRKAMTYQNQLRAELFRAEHPLEMRDVANRLFRVNEMLLTLIQEMSRTFEALRLEVRGLEALGERPVGRVAPPARPREMSAENASPTLTVSETPFEEEEAPPLTFAHRERPVVRRWIESAMKEEALSVPMDARPSTQPIVGRFLTKARLVLHDAILFYVNRLARKQVFVNQTYGDWLLHLHDQIAAQQEEIARLQAQVASLGGQTPPDQGESE